MALTSAELYALILAALTYLQDDGGHFQRGVEKAGLNRDEFWLLNRFRYFPGSVAPSDFLTFGPYTSVAIHEQTLDALVAKKFATQVEAGRYRSNDAARKLIDTLYRDYFNAIAKHDALDDDDVQRLGALADRAVKAAVRQPDVRAPITSAARSTFPATHDPWVYAERRVVAMALFHEDAHIGAWHGAGWIGPRSAVSTALLKTTDRVSAAQLRAVTARLTADDFNAALAALEAGGEIAHDGDDFYRLTQAGRAARQLIEDLTDRNYSAMFNIFDATELSDLIGLVEQLRASIGP